MHPAIILLPAAALLIGPRLWAGHVLKRHNQYEVDLPANASQLARQWLDENQLQAVVVEVTDIGDHYDPEARAIRLTRDKFDRKTLAAVTTAAHEVSHAIQDASGYQPFIWRIKLGKVAQAVGQVGTVMLITVPAAALVSQRPIPPVLIGSTVSAMLASGLSAQMTAMITELDASFRRALPMLRDGYLQDPQLSDARTILVASSMTYIAASLLSVLNIWPWIGRYTALSVPLISPTAVDANLHHTPTTNKAEAIPRENGLLEQVNSLPNSSGSMTETITRKIGKPLIRKWLDYSRAY